MSDGLWSFNFYELLICSQNDVTRVISSYVAQNSTTEMTLHYWWKTAGFYTLSLNLFLVSMDFHQKIKSYNMQHKEALEIKIQLHMSKVLFMWNLSS